MGERETTNPSFENEDQREMWLAGWNQKTNAELAGNEIFCEWLQNAKNNPPSKKQASKHRKEFMQLLETGFGEEVRGKEQMQRTQEWIRESIDRYHR